MRRPELTPARSRSHRAHHADATRRRLIGGSRFKSHSSRRFKALAQVRPAISRLIELSGTPAPNGLTDLWSQMYLLDQGEHLGRNITAFRNRWFTARIESPRVY